MKNLSLVICFFIAAAVSRANIILPSIINNNMVLQQKDSVKLWGWSDVGEIVWITTSWDNHTYHATGTPEANWQLNIKTPAAGGPFKITFRGNNIITLKNVMIGEVWICSGQSN